MPTSHSPHVTLSCGPHVTHVPYYFEIAIWPIWGFQSLLLTFHRALINPLFVFHVSTKSHTPSFLTSLLEPSTFDWIQDSDTQGHRGDQASALAEGQRRSCFPKSKVVLLSLHRPRRLPWPCLPLLWHLLRPKPSPSRPPPNWQLWPQLLELHCCHL